MTVSYSIVSFFWHSSHSSRSFLPLLSLSSTHAGSEVSFFGGTVVSFFDGTMVVFTHSGLSPAKKVRDPCSRVRNDNFEDKLISSFEIDLKTISHENIYHLVCICILCFHMELIPCRRQWCIPGTRLQFHKLAYIHKMSSHMG